MPVYPGALPGTNWAPPPLGDGVELLGAEVTLGSHGSTKARRSPNVGGRRFNDLADVAG